MFRFHYILKMIYSCQPCPNPSLSLTPLPLPATLLGMVRYYYTMLWYLRKINKCKCFHAIHPLSPKISNASPNPITPFQTVTCKSLGAPPLAQRPAFAAKESARARQILCLSVGELAPRAFPGCGRSDRRGSLLWGVSTIEVRTCGCCGGCGPCCCQRIGTV